MDITFRWLKKIGTVTVISDKVDKYKHMKSQLSLQVVWSCIQTAPTALHSFSVTSSDRLLLSGGEGHYFWGSIGRQKINVIFGEPLSSGGILQ